MIMQYIKNTSIQFLYNTLKSNKDAVLYTFMSNNYVMVRMYRIDILVAQDVQKRKIMSKSQLKYIKELANWNKMEEIKKSYNQIKATNKIKINIGRVYRKLIENPKVRS